MANALLFLTNGFEETEALTTVNILRRGNVDVTTVSLTGDRNVTGSHHIVVQADARFEEIADKNAYDMIILPGGPGTSNYKLHKGLLDLIMAYHVVGKQLAAICAAPSIFAMLGILKGKRAVCFPSVRAELADSILTDQSVEIDGNITTSRAAGTAVDFACSLVKTLQNEDVAVKVREAFFGNV